MAGLPLCALSAFDECGAEATTWGRPAASSYLPSHVAADPELRRRFAREAKAIAALNHPHICTLHEFDSQAGTDFLVMEHLDGETLAQRLRKGPLPLDQAVRYAVEITDALDTAHRQGIVHRDLKPGNVMLTKAGAKLLDFGLAKLKDPDTRPDLSTRLTQEDPLTDKGTILGTFQYMAPEQVEGKDADARTDLFAFGAVVYEMVTGKKAFEGKSQLSVISAILERDPPPISTVQPMTPPTLDRIVKKCLKKDPDERWQTARDLHDELAWMAGEGSQVGPVPAAQLRGRQRPIPLALSVLALIVLTGLAVWSLTRSESLTPRQVTRLSATLPPTQRFSTGWNVVAVSPDDTHLAYVANGQLYMRAMDQLEATLLYRGSLTAPVFSPDGQWVAFYEPADRRLKKIAISGGPPVTLCDVASPPQGLSWGPDDTILFTQLGQGILRVPGAGGSAERVITVEMSTSALSPQLLPDGETVLFTSTPASGGTVEEQQVVVESLATGERRVLVEGGRDGRYLPTGHLVYGRAEALLAVPFDAARLEVTGGPVPLVEGVALVGVHQFRVSRRGSLVYVPVASMVGPQAPGRLVWVDRSGSATSLTDDLRRYVYPRLSPDGRRVAVAVNSLGAEGRDVWVYDIERGTRTRLTVEGDNTAPVWTPDGDRVTFSSRRAGDVDLEIYSKPADGSGPAERLVSRPNIQAPTSWSPDGQTLAFRERNDTGGGGTWSTWLLPRGDEPAPFLASAFRERGAVFSPDGHWLAYESDESGRFEVYVRPYPGPGGAVVISIDGGIHPVWSRDGRELFYRRGGHMMAVAVESEPRFTAGSPQVLFEQGYVTRNLGSPNYDVSLDGQRFLMIAEDETDATSAPAQIVVVQDWIEELKARVPTES